MAVFLITYDLHERRDYRRLYELMAEWDACRLAASVWLANLKGPASEVRDIVLDVLDLDDTLAVIQLAPGSGWATARVAPASSEFLSNYVTSAD